MSLIQHCRQIFVCQASSMIRVMIDYSLLPILLFITQSCYHPSYYLSNIVSSHEIIPKLKQILNHVPDWKLNLCFLNHIQSTFHFYCPITVAYPVTISQIIGHLRMTFILSKVQVNMFGNILCCRHFYS